MQFSRTLCLAGTMALAASAAVAQFAPENSLQPQVRPMNVVATLVTATSNAPVDLAFPAWIEEFRGRAIAQGIRPEVYNAAMRGIRYDAKIVSRDRHQAEFSKQIWEYLDTAVSDARVINGRKAASRYGEVLDEIEARYGVEKEVVVAIWGLESAYGSFRGGERIIEAMASLAFDGRRAEFFEEQLVGALKIVQAGDVDGPDMTGSWAGAMGHTQFMPGSYLQYAVDFDGDGRRDIWSDDPTDALASTAAYLKSHGWTKGQPWGIEVTLPEGFDFSQTSEKVKKPASFWNAAGVRDMEGNELPDHGPTSVLLPAGHRGVAFVIYNNFHVIERYNTADAYVIGVGHLSDRIAGANAFAGAWPRDERALSFNEKQELQQRLLASGFDPDGLDGVIGPNTIAAVKAFQASIGMVPDGFASQELLTQLR